MKPRTFLNAILVMAVVLGLLWWWQVTTPVLPVVQPTPVQPPAKPVAVFISTQKLLPEKVTVSTPSSEIDNSDTSPTVGSSDSPTAQGWTSGAIKTAYDYAMAHRGDPSTPAKVYFSVSLDNAEHHEFKIATGNFDASITGYHHALSGAAQGLDAVDLYVWQNLGGGTIAQITTMSLALSYFSPEDQDYIRNWAQQQAAGPSVQTAPTVPSIIELRQLAEQMGIPLSSPDWVSPVQAQMRANRAATTPTVPEPDSQADEQPAALPQGPTVITN